MEYLSACPKKMSGDKWSSTQGGKKIKGQAVSSSRYLEQDTDGQ